MIRSQPPGENRVAWSIILKNNWVSRKERVGQEPEPQALWPGNIGSYNAL